MALRLALLSVLAASAPAAAVVSTPAIEVEVSEFLAKFQTHFSGEDITSLIEEIYHPQCEFWLWDRQTARFKKYIGIPGMVYYVSRMFSMLTAPAGFIHLETRYDPIITATVIWDREVDGLMEEMVNLNLERFEGELKIIHAAIYYDGIDLDTFEPIPYDPPPHIAEILAADPHAP